MRYALVSTLGPFRPERRWHQENALFSWSQVEGVETCIVGADEEKGQKLVADYGFSCHQDVLRAYDVGYFSKAPIIPPLLEKALAETTAQWLVLINSDIAVMPEFPAQLDQVLEQIKGHENPFITIRRRDYQCRRAIETREALLQLRNVGARLHKYTGSDIFITSRTLWQKIATEMPAFIYGRFSWDVYFHHCALEKASVAVDASETVESYHPYHGSLVDRTNPEMVHNLQMYEALFGEGIFALQDPRWLRL